MNVRLYRPADRAAVHCICADTAFFGAPIEAFWGNRRLFTDYFAATYTDLEQQYLWVAEATEQVVGYLMGCPDTRQLDHRVRRHILPRMLARVAMGRYRLDARTRRFIGQYIVSSLRGELAHIDLACYPAHLHINIALEWRGNGLGKRLLHAFLAQLRSADVPGAHLETSDHNIIAVPLYEKLGFRLLDRRPTRLYMQATKEPVHALTYGLLLLEGAAKHHCHQAATGDG